MSRKSIEHSIKSSLDRDRLPTEGSQTYRARNSWVVGVHSVPIAGSPDALTRPGDSVKAFQDVRFAEDALDDWRRAFALRPVIDLRVEAARVVTAINKGKSGRAIANAKRAFLDGLEVNNLCWKCKEPIATKKDVVMKWVEEPHPVTGELIRKTVPVSEKELEYRRTNPRLNASGREISRAMHARTRTFYATRAEVLSHYEWVWLDDTTAGLRFVDGSNRDIRVERTPYTIKRESKGWRDRSRPHDEEGRVEITKFKERLVEVLPDGTTQSVVPNSTYTILNRKCECKHRRAKVRKITSVV